MFNIYLRDYFDMLDSVRTFGLSTIFKKYTSLSHPLAQCFWGLFGVYLHKNGCARGYVEGLVRGLRDPDPWVRERGAHALKALEDPGATMLLVEALRDPCARGL